MKTLCEIVPSIALNNGPKRLHIGELKRLHMGELLSPWATRQKDSPDIYQARSFGLALGLECVFGWRVCL